MDVVSDTRRCENCAGISARAIVAALAALWAVWFAAGAAGLLAPPLGIALCWIALGIAIAAGWAAGKKAPRDGAGFAAAIALAAAMLASTQPLFAVPAVAAVLAAMAYWQRGAHRRLLLLPATAALVLTIFRLCCASIPCVHYTADACGHALGLLAAAITGEPLSVGATLGGIDVLLTTAVVCGGWIACTLRPRLRRSIVTAVAIVGAQLIYLAAVTYHVRWLEWLPEPFVPTSDLNHVGETTFSSIVRSGLPWNLPILAAVLQSLVMLAVFRWSPVPPETADGAEQPSSTSTKAKPPQGRAAAIDAALKFGPPLLAVALAVLATATSGNSDLRGKTIVAYDQGFVTWQKPEHRKPDAAGSQMFGMLPTFVESLGGKLLRSSELTAQELAAADVLVLLHPNRPWTKDRIDRIWQYVENGGALLLAAGPPQREGDRQSTFDELLEPAKLAVRCDTAVPALPYWRQCCEAAAHPANAGTSGTLNAAGLAQAASIAAGWGLRPILTAPYARSCPGSEVLHASVALPHSGEPVGDLLLAAERSFGRGRVVVLGDSTPLGDDGLVAGYEFTGRLLGYLASKGDGPQAWWRQMLGLLAAVGLVALLFWQIDPLRLAITAGVLAITLAACAANNARRGEVLPDGRGRPFNNIAYIDTSHLEPFSRNRWDTLGLGRFARLLMRNGYLPLLLNEISPERLQRAGLLVSIAPAASFSTAEYKAIGDFATDGGAVLLTVGAEEAVASRELLAQFQLNVPASPVAPGDASPEPYPLGAHYSEYLQVGDFHPGMRFYAAWPVESRDVSPPQQQAGPAEVLKYGMGDEAVIVRRPIGRGSVTVVGDTFFSVNENLGPTTEDPEENPTFWRWFLPRITGRPDWTPTKPAAKSDVKTGVKEPIAPDTPLGDENGVRNHLCAAPSGPFRQMVPDTVLGPGGKP